MISASPFPPLFQRKLEYGLLRHASEGRNLAPAVIPAKAGIQEGRWQDIGIGLGFCVLRRAIGIPLILSFLRLQKRVIETTGFLGRLFQTCLRRNDGQQA